MQILPIWNFMKKNQKMGLGPSKIPLNFESDLDQHLDTKKTNLDFPIYTLLCDFVVVCSLQKVLFLVCFWLIFFHHFLALLKAQVSLQLGKVFSSDNGVSVSIIYLYMY